MGYVKSNNKKWKGKVIKPKVGKNEIRTQILDKSGRKRIIPIRRD